MRRSTLTLPLAVTFVVLGLAAALAARTRLLVRPAAAAPAKAEPAAVEPVTAKPQPAPAPPGPLAPNEAGQIMVLMYHRFEPKPGDWNRTPADFRRDLETLYREGYRLLPLRDLLAGRITTPRGYTPVVLTFDDGWRTQCNYLEKDGKLEVDPDSAVGILEAFAKAHPDMGLAGTFYLNADPFGQPKLAKAKLEHLIGEGFELGNHTVNHTNLRQASAQVGRKEMAGMVTIINQLVPGHRMDTMALPFGALPHDRSVAVSGTVDGVSYHNKAVLLVGANPAPSPYATAFDPLNLPRVQGSEAELGRWLAYFRSHPEARFVSDGKADVITVPASRRGELGAGLPTEQGRKVEVLPAASPGAR